MNVGSFEVLMRTPELVMNYRSRPDATGIDAVLTDPSSGRRLGVQIKHRSSGSLISRDIVTTLGYAVLAKEGDLADSFLVVTSASLSRASEDVLRQAKRASPIPFGLVNWRDATSDESVERAIRSLLSD